MNDWEPIGTAPRDGTRIIVANHEDQAMAKFDGPARLLIEPQVWSGGGEDGGLAEVDFTPTHWRPVCALPVKPTET